MIKKIFYSLMFIIIVFMSLYGLNNFNRSRAEKRIIQEQTPPKFSKLIEDYEELLGNPAIKVKNLNSNIYRQYTINDSIIGFILGTMGYEEEMLVYVELTYEDVDKLEVLQVDILYENETDGYGDYVVEPWFLDRFRQAINEDFNLVKRKKTKDNQVIAITGATITSQAIVTAVNDCRQIMEDSKNEKE